MAKLHLTLACGDYDRTKTLQDGSLDPVGIALNYLPMEAEEIFWRMGHHQEFDRLRDVAVQLHHHDLPGREPVHGHPDLPVPLFPPFLRVHQHRPGPGQARGSRRQAYRRCGIRHDRGGVDTRFPERRPRGRRQGRRVVHRRPGSPPDGRNASSSGCRRRSRCNPSPTTGP